VICLWVLLFRILYGHAPSLTPPLSPVEVEALPSHRVVLSRLCQALAMVISTMASSDFPGQPVLDGQSRGQAHPASPWTSLPQLIPAVTVDMGHRPSETSPVPSPTFTTSRSPYAGEFPGLSGQDRLHGCSSRFFAASMAFAFADKLGSLLSPFRG
jgi:hypothetical protein